MRDALASWHMGRVIAAYRTHPIHRRQLSQELVGSWVGRTQAQISRIENGPPIKDLDRLTLWARTLRIPAPLLWFKLPEDRPNADIDGHLATTGRRRAQHGTRCAYPSRAGRRTLLPAGGSNGKRDRATGIPGCPSIRAPGAHTPHQTGRADDRYNRGHGNPHRLATNSGRQAQPQAGVAG